MIQVLELIKQQYIAGAPVMRTLSGLSIMALITLGLSGCGGAPSSVGPPVLGGPGAISSGMQNPAAGLIDNVKTAITGSGKEKLAMAEDLLTSNANPFLVKIPIPVETVVTDPGSGEAAPVVADPFEGLNLVGIVYNKDNPMALLSYAGMEQTHMVKKGQLVEGEINVLKIDRDSVELKKVDSGEKVTLYLPDIVGYAPGGNASSGTDGAGFPPGGEPPSGAPGATLQKVGDIIKDLQDI